MGNKTRQQIIRFLETKLAIISASNEEYENDDGRTLELLAYFTISRYLGPRSLVPKIDTNTKYNLLLQLDENRVRQEIRMDLDSFNKLYDIISSHHVYSAYPGRRRTPIKIQMMVALERLGCYGNGASVGKMARSAGISGK